MPVTFGCSLPSRGAMASPDNLRNLAQRAEDLSFDHVWVSDHIVIPHEVASFYPYAADGVAPFQRDNTYFEPLAALNFLAGCTTRVRLGTHVLILPYRNPVLTAKVLATLDVLSGGRLILGAGVGWMDGGVSGDGAGYLCPAWGGDQRIHSDFQGAVDGGQPGGFTASTMTSAGPAFCPSRCSSRTRRSGSAGIPTRPSAARRP